jgi:hypothetical protein
VRTSSLACLLYFLCTEFIGILNKYENVSLHRGLLSADHDVSVAVLNAAALFTEF